METNELKHYGVLGMKWGVRRFQPYPSNHKGSGKEVGLAKKKSQRIGYNDDVIVKKGTKAYRISRNALDSGEQRYVTIDENDRNFYKGMWPRAMKGSAGIAGKTSNIYEQTYKIQEDLISPSAAKRQKMAAELASTKEGKIAITFARMVNNTARSNNISIAKAKEYISQAPEDYCRKQVKLLSDVVDKQSEVGKARMFLSAMGSSDAAKMMLGKRVIEAGYNMVIDDHGADFAGNKRKINAPVIVLKADKLLKQVGSKKVSELTSEIALSKYLSDISSIPGEAAKNNYVPNVLKKAYGTNNYYKNNSTNYIYDEYNNRIK